jgi:hypothetical protein
MLKRIAGQLPRIWRRYFSLQMLPDIDLDRHARGLTPIDFPARIYSRAPRVGKVSALELFFVKEAGKFAISGCVRVSLTSLSRAPIQP